MASRRNLRLAGAVVALASIGWWISGREPGRDEESESRASSHPRGDAPDIESAPRIDEPPPPPEPVAEPVPSFDPTELAQVLYDGGIPEPTPAYDPPVVPPPPVGAGPVAAAPPFELPTRRVGPPEPRTVLRSAIFWRGLLEQRIEAISAQREAARVSGNAAAEQRAARMLERLRAQEPAIAERIAELEATVPPEPREAPGEP